MDWIVRRIVARTGPRAVAAVIASSVLLCLPSLWAPFAADEYMQARKLAPEHWGPPFPLGGPGIAGAFEFVSPRSGGTEAAVQQGFFGWWTLPEFQLAFWRPLSAATHLLDYRAWPDHLAFMHGHSLVWQVLLFLLVARLFARFVDPRTAVLALALYCWDDARGFTLGFLANRNALIAGIFGILTLLAHDRWRTTGRPHHALLSALTLALGLASAELALSTTAWLFAYAAFLDRSSLRQRALSLLPAALVVLAWKLTYSAMGYGVVGSGVYVHPFSSPARFALRFAERAPWYAMGQLFVVPSDLALAFPPAIGRGFMVLGVGVFAAFAGLFAPLWRTRPEARFFATGALLSVVPICGSFTSDRNLTFVSLGGAALLAMWLVQQLDQGPSGWRRPVFHSLVLVHLVLAPLVLPLRCLTTLGVDTLLARVAPPTAALPVPEGHTTVYAWVSSDAWPGFGRVRALSTGQPTAERAVALVMSEGPATFHRLDDHTLRIEVVGFQTLESQQMGRSADHPFTVGHTTDLPDVRITVEEVDENGHPTVILAEFHQPLDHPRFVWQAETTFAFPLWTPPAVGETVTVGGMPWAR